MSCANVTRIPVQMKRGAKVRKGPTAEVMWLPVRHARDSLLRGLIRESLTCAEHEIRPSMARYRAAFDEEAAKLSRPGGYWEWRFLRASETEEWEAFKALYRDDDVLQSAFRRIELRHGYQKG